MKRVVLASLFSLLIIGAIAVGYFYYQQLKTPSLDAVNAIPSDAAFIIETTDAAASWKALKESPIWKELISTPHFSSLNSKGLLLDSLFLAGDNTSKIYNSQTLFFSAHVTKANDFDFLFLLNLPKIGQESFVNELMSEITGDKTEIAKRMYDGVSIREFPVGKNKELFSYCVIKGIFIGSFTAFLVEDAIRQLHIGKPFTLDKNFTKVFDAAGSKVDANIFINFKNFPNLIASFLNIEGADGLKSFSPFASWAGLDIKLKNKIVSINGFTSAEKSSDFINVMKSQKPGDTKMIKVLPAKTSLFIHQYFSDLNVYRQNFKKYLTQNNSIKSYNDSLEKYTDVYRLNVEERMSSWIGNELAVVITEAGGSNVINNSLIVAGAKDIAQAQLSLGELSAFASGKYKIASETYKKDYQIKYLGLDGIWGILFGKMYSGIKKSYYTVVGDYVVFANSSNVLKNFIDDYILKKTLSNHAEYRMLSDNLSQRSSCFVYANMSSIPNVIRYFASRDFEKSLAYNINVFGKFESFAMQISSEANNDLFYNNIVLNQYTAKKEEINQLWAAKLESSVSMKPVLVVNHNTFIREIMVQDDANNLYLIDNSGEILWQKKLSEPIVGTIHQIDYYKNGKLQYLFNTSGMLHLLDRNSDNVANFPIKLPAAASAGLSLFDYDSKLDYRIFVPCGKNVYTYQTSGKPIEGWGFNKPLSNVICKVQHFSVNDKDYIIISDDQGQVYFLDRKGEKRFDLQEKILLSKNAVWELVKADKPYFENADRTGKIYKIFMDGTFEKQSINFMENIEPGFGYLHKDIDGDKVYDNIFLDRDKLYVFKSDNTLLFTRNFDAEITTEMQHIQISETEYRIGISSEKTDEIFMINNDGYISPGFPLKGSTAFVTGDLNNDGHFNIVAGSKDGYLYVYTMK